MNSEPTTINDSNDSNDALSVIRRQRHLSIRNRNKNKNTRKKYNFITTIETEKYTDEEEEEEECPICLDNVKCIKLVKLNCDHKFCVRCVIKSVKMNRNNYSCALCRCVVETVRVYDTDTYDLVRQL
jgi:hypothetical protein